MAVKIRLARVGAKKRPCYRIIVADARAPRDGNFIERVGIYNPLLPKDSDKRVILERDRIEYWITNGAIPTDPVTRFMNDKGIALPKSLAVKMKIKAENIAQKKSSKKDSD